ncbi:hypothetical protein PENSPDRAFT_747112 [Peniophora sp. CONT]|nr:hypothetical protein PENSPDRAFT_747112 [Peniophora sp. CONT]
MIYLTPDSHERGPPARPAEQLLLANDFARNGYKVIEPDLFEGEPVDVATLDDPRSRASFAYVGWLSRHTPARNLPRVHAVLEAL